MKVGGFHEHDERTSGHDIGPPASAMARFELGEAEVRERSIPNHRAEQRQFDCDDEKLG
jgi:hypothetical protein